MTRRTLTTLLTIGSLALAVPSAMAQSTTTTSSTTTTPVVTTTSTGTGTTTGTTSTGTTTRTSTTTSGSPAPSAFSTLSPGNQKIAQALFDAQTTTGSTAPLTLDQIAAVKQSGQGWGRIFQQMKAQGLVTQKNLGQVVSGANHTHYYSSTTGSYTTAGGRTEYVHESTLSRSSLSSSRRAGDERDDDAGASGTTGSRDYDAGHGGYTGAGGSGSTAAGGSGYTAGGSGAGHGAAFGHSGRH